MAHLIALADSYGSHHQCFKMFMGKRSEVYKDKKTGVRIREIKLYDIIYPEIDEKQVFSDLKFFEFNRRNHLWIIDKVKALIFKIIPGIENVDMGKVTATKFTKEDMKILANEDWFMYLKILGKVKDSYREGQELL